jgi:hypothetical protein
VTLTLATRSVRACDEAVENRCLSSHARAWARARPRPHPAAVYGAASSSSPAGPGAIDCPPSARSEPEPPCRIPRFS